ncbi:hypothetical protein SADUNF_Sadunf10G0014500 [Salix dunnii]|uniref:Uncharacterized protein n=1 Tax=Salix dunnii TaxID=1413687 RepID=A0A835JP69_9ROSI|nr:hypothetical protein SADUNF_Sadunf10G0014500 [Salix dunnii]
MSKKLSKWDDRTSVLKLMIFILLVTKGHRPARKTTTTTSFSDFFTAAKNIFPISKCMIVSFQILQAFSLLVPPILFLLPHNVATRSSVMRSELHLINFRNLNALVEKAGRPRDTRNHKHHHDITKSVKMFTL